MSHGILSLPVLPVRSEPSERAEMTTQLLFGERFELLDEQGTWSRIRNLTDGYEGWVTSKMLTRLTDELSAQLAERTPVVLPEPLLFFHSTDVGQFYLPAGSILHTQGKHFFFVVGESVVELFPERSPRMPSANIPLSERVLETAFQFLNAPYLWGGKTVLGMDCSGLMQVSAAVNGFSLPRDARNQALLGEEQFFSLALPGDLAFFANAEGRIVHVGLVCGPHEILHASGCVRVDKLDGQGIYNADLKQYTHQLHSIKRIFPS